MTLVCFALKEEAAPFRKIAPGLRDCSVLISGIGRRNAGSAVRAALSASPMPKLVLTCGFAGGLDPALEIGAVIFETGDPALREGLLAAGARPARIFCADRIAITVAEKAALRQTSATDAVEMESGEIHAVCRERGVPCATVRVISDAANDDLPLDFNALAKPDQSLDFGKLALAIARAPGKIGALLRLQKNTNRAARQLAEVLRRLVNSA